MTIVSGIVQRRPANLICLRAQDLEGHLKRLDCSWILKLVLWEWRQEELLCKDTCIGLPWRLPHPEQFFERCLMSCKKQSKEHTNRKTRKEDTDRRWSWYNNVYSYAIEYAIANVIMLQATIRLLFTLSSAVASFSYLQPLRDLSWGLFLFSR